MSIVTPWRREESSPKEKAAQQGGRARLPGFKRMGLGVLVILLCGLASYLWYLWTQGYFRGVQLIQLASVSGDAILDIYGDVALVRHGAKISVLRLGEPTNESSFGLEASDAIIQEASHEPVIALVSGKSVYTVGSQGPKKVAELAENQRVLPVRGHSLFLAFSPPKVLAYGASFSIQAFSQSGRALWQTAIPSIPFFAICDGSQIALAAIDISQTQACRLFLLNAEDGSINAQRSLGEGYWRDIYITSGYVMAILDRKIAALDKTGESLWEFSSEAPIISSCLASDGVVFASASPKRSLPIPLAPRSKISYFHLGGRLIWERNLTIYAEGLTWAKDTILAYNKYRVIGFSYKTGEVEFSLRPRYPLERASASVLLAKKDGGYLFWKLKEGQEDP